MSPDPNQSPILSLHFDVFGTVVDWHGGLAPAFAAYGQRHGLERDWNALARHWRGLYQPALERVRNGARPWTILDDLHRESVLEVAAMADLPPLSPADMTDLVTAWHRLDPWPDSVPGLTRLKTRFAIVTLSNGNVALLINMARRAGLPWDAILGAEFAKSYKPKPETYLANARALGHAPGQCLMVAAHEDDLDRARACGFRTAFIARPLEHGRDVAPSPSTPTGEWDFAVAGLDELATALGC